MIHTLAFANYRSLRDVKLKLGKLNLVTGANGAGKSNVYRALRLLVDASEGRLARALATEGGMPSALWSGPERTRDYREKKVEREHQGTVRREPIRLGLGFAADDFAFELLLGLPTPGSLGPSAFGLDPEVKEEHVWTSVPRRRQNALLERKGHLATVRDVDGAWSKYPGSLDTGESVLAQIAEPHRYPELSALRERMRRWRFYHQFRTDPDSPLRQTQAGARTPVLSHDGHDVAAALQTIREIGDGEALDAAIEEAFDGAALDLATDAGRFEIGIRAPGVLRALRATELSDGTLRYLCLLAALLSPRPPGLLVLNEPETSLHPDLLRPLAKQIVAASRTSQVVVVSHAERLIAAIENATDANTLELIKEDGETRVAGQRLLDEPAWP